jgi:putative membrane protein
MLKREHLPHVLGAAMLAVMFGATTTVHSQVPTDSAGKGAAGSSSATPSPSGSSSTSGKSGTSGASAAGGTSDTSGASGGAGSGAASSGASSGASTTGGSSAASGASDKGGSSAASGAGDKASADKSAGGAGLSKADQSMMRQMAYTNISEIEAAKLAQSKSKNEQVQSFAKQMIDDHTKAQSELEQLAQTKGVKLPTEPDAKHKAAMKKLSGLSGAAFDRSYIKQGGVNDHKEAHSLVTRAQAKATDPDLKAYAQKMTPIIDSHLKLAQAAQGGKSAASAASGASGTKGSGASAAGGKDATGGSSAGAAGGASSTEPKNGSSGAGSAPGAGGPGK